MGMNRWMSILVLVCVGLIGQRLCAAEKLPGYLQVGDQKLVLNGSGARTKTLLELYTAGLYLAKPNRDSATVLAADEPMALRIKITSSLVSKSSLVDALEEGFNNVTGGNTREIRSEINQLRAFFNEGIKKGDVFDMVYLPQHGLIVNKNGKYVGAIVGAKFKSAFFGIWLAEKPVDSALKQALLSGSVVR